VGVAVGEGVNVAIGEAVAVGLGLLVGEGVLEGTAVADGAGVSVAGRAVSVTEAGVVVVTPTSRSPQPERMSKKGTK